MKNLNKVLVFQCFHPFLKINGAFLSFETGFEMSKCSKLHAMVHSPIVARAKLDFVRS